MSGRGGRRTAAARRVLLPVLGVTAVAAVGFGLAEGTAGVYGALLGGAVVILFLGSTPVILTPLVRRSAAMSLPVALTFLGVKSVAALVVLALLFDVGGLADRIDFLAFGITAIAASLSWTILQIVAYRNERVPTYDLSNNE
jgi:ATP synthase protein I